MDLSNKASNLRKKLGADGEAPIDIFKLVQKIENLTLVFMDSERILAESVIKELSSVSLQSIQTCH